MKNKIVELNIDEMIFGGESINNTAFDKKVEEINFRPRY